MGTMAISNARSTWAVEPAAWWRCPQMPPCRATRCRPPRLSLFGQSSCDLYWIFRMNLFAFLESLSLCILCFFSHFTFFSFSLYDEYDDKMIYICFLLICARGWA